MVQAETFKILNELPIKGHRYEFIAGKARKDGKFPVYMKDIVLVQNGNQTYWSRRAPKRLIEVKAAHFESVLLVRDCVYVILRRSGISEIKAREMANDIK